MSQFRKIVENILKEKKLSQQEIDKYMQDVDDNDSYWKSNKSNWEKEEEERNKRDEEIMKRPLNLTQSDIEKLLQPCIGMRTDQMYIPIKNKSGKIDIYTLDSHYMYGDNTKPLQELSKKELLDIISKSYSDLTPEELYWFINQPGSYDEGYDIKKPSADEELLYVSKILQNLENGEGYKETYGIRKLFNIFKYFLILSSGLRGNFGELADDSGYVIYIDIPKEERKTNKTYKELVDIVEHYKKLANTEEEILRMAPVDGEDRMAILITTNMDKYIV